MVLATKGRRLLLIGGIAVVALATASFLMMGAGDGAEHAAGGSGGAKRVPGASSDARARASSASGGGSGPELTAPDLPDAELAEADAVFQRTRYTYRSLGRLDPFRSLVVAKDSASRAFAEKLDPEMIQLVGILVHDDQRRALVEDVHGFGYVLEEGDRVLRGRVVSIGEESIKIRHTMYGVTETTTLSLVRKRQGRGLSNDRLR